MVKAIFGFAALVLGVIPFFPYLRDIFAGKTKPHLYSWLVWSVLQTTGVVAMVLGGAGYGAMGLGFNAIFVFVVLALSFKFGTKNITLFDTFCFIGALAAVAAWIVEKNPLYSVVLVTLIDFVAFLPTYRKSYVEPYTETPLSYALWALSDVCGVAALASYSVVTTLYVASLIATNALCVAIILLRRRTRA